MINEQNIFGDIANSVEELKELIPKNYAQPQQQLYKDRYADIVNFNDGQNTERVIQCLIKDGLIAENPARSQVRVMTYGNFDLLHHGHINLLKKAKAKGDFLVVGLSTDDFSKLKGEKTYHDYETRKYMLEALSDVDLVVPEDSWEQKTADVKKYNIDVVVMGDDWADSPRLSDLDNEVRVEFVERTPEISTALEGELANKRQIRTRRRKAKV